MGRPRQMIEPGALYDVTSTTLRSEFKLRPGAALNAAILGVIGRALFHWKNVKLHYFVVLSNHLHMLLSGDDGESLSQFVGFVNRNLATKVGDLLGDPGILFGRRAKWIRVVDEKSMIARLHYLLAQGCKEGLVATPADWPGATAYPAFVGDMTLRAVWHDRNGETQASRSRRNVVDPSRFQVEHPIQLTPIPPFAALAPEELRAKHEEIVARVIAEENARHVRLGRVVLGAAVVLAMSTRARPSKMKRTPAPLCHAATAEAREAYRTKYRAFVAAYVAASEALRSGKPATFPPGAFPCRGRWVPFETAAPRAPT